MATSSFDTPNDHAPDQGLYWGIAIGIILLLAIVYAMRTENMTATRGTTSVIDTR